MPTQSRLTISGLSAINAQMVAGTVANTLTATGSTQATALLLGADLNRFTTVAAATGAIIAPLNPGDSVHVYNAGANALLLYPPVGGTINALGLNAGYSIATATPSCTLRCITPTQYQAFQAA